MKRTERLFALAEHLRARRHGITAEALAARFGVTVRTIYRDLDALRAAELPIDAERGPGGGYALARDYNLPPVNFTPREAALLLTLGRHAAQLRLLPFTETLQRGLEKLQGALSGAAQRELLARLAQLEFVGVPALPVAEGVREAIERAWFEDAPVRLRYLDRNLNESERTVQIQGVVLDRRETLLRVRQCEDGEARTLRLDRILHAERLERASQTSP